MRTLLLVAVGLLSIAGCSKKESGGAPQGASSIGGLPAGMLTIPIPQPPPPQGNPNAPHVGPAECNYSIDKQINLYTQRDPRIKAQLTSARSMALQQCLAKWTHDEYDCVVAAKTLEDLVLCKRFERP